MSINYIQESTFTYSTGVTNYTWRFKYDREAISSLIKQKKIILWFAGIASVIYRLVSIHHPAFQVHNQVEAVIQKEPLQKLFIMSR